MEKKKRSFFERLTGSLALEEESSDLENGYLGKNGRGEGRAGKSEKSDGKNGNWIEEENDEAELTVDVYQTPTDIVVQAMAAGVRPEDLEVSIARDTVTIRGERQESRTINEEDYFAKELYWGKFSRTITLPAEVEPEEVEATERHGLLTVKIKKVDKGKKSSIKVRSI